MTEKRKITPPDPSKIGVRPVPRPPSIEKLQRLRTPVREISEDIAGIVEKHHAIQTATIRLHGDAEVTGEVQLTKSPQPGRYIDVFVEGDLDDSKQTPKGDAFACISDGEVFFQSAANRPPYAETGDIVKKGTPVLWFMESKSVQQALPAPTSGKITYVVENGQKVRGKHIAIDENGNPLLDTEGKEIEVEAAILFYIDTEQS